MSDHGTRLTLLVVLSYRVLEHYSFSKSVFFLRPPALSRGVSSTKHYGLDPPNSPTGASSTAGGLCYGDPFWGSTDGQPPRVLRPGRRSMHLLAAARDELSSVWRAHATLHLRDSLTGQMAVQGLPGPGEWTAESLFPSRIVLVGRGLVVELVVGSVPNQLVSSALGHSDQSPGKGMVVPA